MINGLNLRIGQVLEPVADVEGLGGRAAAACWMDGTCECLLLLGCRSGWARAAGAASCFPFFVLVGGAGRPARSLTRGPWGLEDSSHQVHLKLGNIFRQRDGFELAPRDSSSPWMDFPGPAFQDEVLFSKADICCCFEVAFLSDFEGEFFNRRIPFK